MVPCPAFVLLYHPGSYNSNFIQRCGNMCLEANQVIVLGVTTPALNIDGPCTIPALYKGFAYLSVLITFYPHFPLTFLLLTLYLSDIVLTFLFSEFICFGLPLLYSVHIPFSHLLSWSWIWILPTTCPCKVFVSFVLATMEGLHIYEQ